MVGLSRRTLLQGALLLPGLRAAEAIEPSPPSRPLAALSEAEIDDLVAFGEILVEGRSLPPAERGHLVEHVRDRVARRSDYPPLYRDTVALLESLAGKRFSQLDVRERIDVIARHRLAAFDVRPADRPAAASAEVWAVRARVVRDLVGGYYNSPAGWAVVGYTHFPGRCGDLTRYTRPEA
jgi:hypothetical protein